jgi:hypothetical protein
MCNAKDKYQKYSCKTNMDANAELGSLANALRGIGCALVASGIGNHLLLLSETQISE